MNFSKVASKESIDNAIISLKKNGISAELVQTGSEAKDRLLELIPKGSSVMTMTSVTLDTIGFSELVENSGEFNSIKAKLNTLNHETEGLRMQELGAAPEWAIGSVHAVTEDGKVVIASATGSQLPAYAYGSGNVIWVVGGQKIVKDIDTAMKRIEEYTLPLESERAHKVYGVPGSSINKVLIINNEINAKRIKMIIVNEALGF